MKAGAAIMSDQINDQEAATPALAFPTDSFEPVLALIALVTSPKDCKARVKELREAATDTKKAIADLATARAAHDENIATDRAALNDERAQFTKRLVRLRGEEGVFAAKQELLERERTNPSRRKRLVEVGGITREFHDEIDAREPMITGGVSTTPNPQNNLPMLRKTRQPIRPRKPLETFANTSLTREPD
jgi:hypothetical protein